MVICESGESAGMNASRPFLREKECDEGMVTKPEALKKQSTCAFRRTFELKDNFSDVNSAQGGSLRFAS